MKQRLGISEILFETSKIHDREKRVQFLRDHYSPVLVKVVQYALDPKIKWKLPPGEPPFRVNEAPEAWSSLYSKSRELYLFLDPECGGHPNLTQNKREDLFIRMLESISKDDARLLLSAKDKKVPYRWIGCALFEEAFPGSFPEVRENIDESNKKNS